MLGLMVIRLILLVALADAAPVRIKSIKFPRTESHSHLGEYTTAAVAADNVFCSEIGRDILLRGGNAVDAAVAAVFCIGVMDMQSAGLGGGHFMTIFNATTKKCATVDAREEAPLASKENMFIGRWKGDSLVGWRAVAVPGELHGLRTEFEQFGSGKVSWRDLITPTLELLEKGFPVSTIMDYAMNSRKQPILADPSMSFLINPDTGKFYQAGDVVKTRSDLYKTLKQLAMSDDPIDLFYRGEMAKSMAKEFEENGGIITLEDFNRYRSIVRSGDDVVQGKFKDGLQVCGSPPPSSSAVTIGILKILDGFDFENGTSEDTVDHYHKFLEASKFAYSQRSHLGDPKFVKDAMEVAQHLTSDEFADWARSRISDRTHPESYYDESNEAPPEDHGTTHISVIDKDGNTVAVTTTINLYFGAAVKSKSTGIVWNDEMDDFSSPGASNIFGYQPSKPNFIKPTKRPLSSMSPLIFYKIKNDNDAVEDIMAIGAAGGSKIISGVASIAFQHFWLGRDLKQAADSPRIHNQLHPNIVEKESRFSPELLRELERRGHNFTYFEERTGAVATIVRRTADGKIWAHSDFRKGYESTPAGY